MDARLRVLSRRATLINRAFALCVLGGLLVSLVVAALFISSSLLHFSARSVYRDTLAHLRWHAFCAPDVAKE